MTYELDERRQLYVGKCVGILVAIDNY